MEKFSWTDRVRN